MDLKGKEITPEEREIIIKLRNDGKTLREIDKIVGRTHFSIRRVINNYTSSKSIISKARSERPSKLTAREKRYVFKSCMRFASFRDMRVATTPFEEETGMRIEVEERRGICGDSMRIEEAEMKNV
ncbi:hypothetical protein CDAR_580711 [Caerostris darwini]|uniref:Transposase IS30-like HTH domain-containing protein n=1 Tax=Caerostris darwini TaxID=1538125 RepID=A0AAV4TWN7_9ARAC|nr:hypothetical protein CDAR_580711 [Caerostris darwini]